MATLTRQDRRNKRHFRARKKIHGDDDRPRLAVFRSNQHITAQIINDETHLTLCASASYSPEFKKDIKGRDKSGAENIGKSIAEKAIAKGIKKVVFDCGGYKYHGRVKALAEAARKAGLEF